MKILRSFLTTSVLFLLIPSLLHASCETTVDGNCRLDVDIISYSGISEPAVSNPGKGSAYYDSTLDKIRCSENGGAYEDCVGGSGGASYLTGLSDVSSATATSGSVLVANGTTFDSISVGTNNQVIVADSSKTHGIKWANQASGFADPMTTRGDVIIRDASNATARLGVGTNGQALVSDGTDISWGTAGGGATYLTGLSDVNSATVTAGYLLVADGTDFESVTLSGEVTLKGDGTATVGPIAQLIAGGLTAAQNTGAYDMSDAKFAYDCNDTTGTNVDDATTNSNDGTANFNIASYTTTGKVGDGFSLLSNRGIEYPDLGIFDGSGDFTVAIWVKFNSVTTTQTIWGSDGEHSWDIQIDHNAAEEKIRVRNWDGSTNDTILTSSNTFSTGTWYLIIFSHDSGSTSYLYVNNSQEASGTMQTDPLAVSNKNMIGTDGSESTGVSGIIDMVRIWDRVITSDERATLYNSGSGTETLSISAAAPVHAIGTSNFTLPDGITSDLKTLAVQGDVYAVDDVLVGDDLTVNGLITAGTLYNLPTALPYKKHVLGAVSAEDETYWQPINEERQHVSKWDDESLTSIGLFTDLHVPNYGVHTYSETIFQTMVDGINDFQPDFIVELGDFMDGSQDDVPADYIKEWVQGERIWVNFQSPAYHMMGNHEIYAFGDSDSEYDEALAYWLNLNNRTVPYWYKDYNGIRFIFLATNYKNNTTDDWEDLDYIGSTQKTWFEALIDATSSATPIVMLSHSTITVAAMQDVQTKLEAFETGGGTVLVCLAGHAHDNNQSTENGIDYIRFQRPTSSTAAYSKITFDPDDVDGDGDYYYVEGEGGHVDYNGAPPKKSLAVYNGDFDGAVDINGILTLTNGTLVIDDNTAGKMLVADGTDYEPVAMSGDVTIASNGATTIQADAVSLSELSDVNTTTQGLGRLLVSDGTDFESQVISGDCTLAADGAMACSGGVSGNNNEVLTDDGAGGIVSESNLTFDGTDLTVLNDLKIQGGDVDDYLTITSSGNYSYLQATGHNRVYVSTDQSNADATLWIKGNGTGEAIFYLADGTTETDYAYWMVSDTTLELGINSGLGEYIINTMGYDVDYSIQSDNEDRLFWVDGGEDDIRMGDYDTNYVQISNTGVMTFAGAGEISPGLTALADVSTATATGGNLLVADGTDWESITVSGDVTLLANGTAILSSDGSIQFTLDGGGSAITTGEKAWLQIPFAMDITSVEVTADQSCNIVTDIWVDSYANFPPDNTDSICDGGTCPTLSGATKSQDTSLTSWTTSIAQWSYMKANVDSVSTCERTIISIQGTKK